jgi:MbtH protein
MYKQLRFERCQGEIKQQPLGKSWVFQKKRFGLRHFLATMKSMNDSEQDQIIYKVVINHEEQYSIWPADRANPLGWRDVGKEGRKPECLAYIKEVWTDMRPLSLRKQMDAAQGV